MTASADTVTVDGRVYKAVGAAPKANGKGKGKGKDGNDSKCGGKSTAVGQPVGAAHDAVASKPPKGGRGKGRSLSAGAKANRKAKSDRRKRSRSQKHSSGTLAQAPADDDAEAPDTPSWAVRLGPLMPPDAEGRIRHPLG